MRGAICLVLAAALFWGGQARADFDIDKNPLPKFVKANYIDLHKISRIAKYRSHVGHNYSDGTQFGSDGIKDSSNRVETCVSMKHYFLVPDSSVRIYAPVSGKITAYRTGVLGGGLEIQSDAYPDFNLGIFHVEPSIPLKVGDHVEEGQLIGTHTGTETWSDFSVWVQTPRGKHLISLFDIMTDELFAQYQARGVTSRSQLQNPQTITPPGTPITCAFSNLDADIVNLTGPIASQQSLTVSTVLNDIMRIGDTPVEVKGAASSGLPVVVVSATPKVCAVANNTMTPRRPGVCKLSVTQPGDDEHFAATPVILRTRILPTYDPAPDRPRLGLVYPPSASGPQSYIRFYNTGTTAGTVTASLINATTGQTVAKWTSPSIAPASAPQFGIADLEAAAAPGFARPSAYTVKIEPETTMNGYLQHVLFDANLEALSNASTCDMGVTTDASRLVFVHSSRMDYGYPSTLVLNNLGSGQTGMGLALRDATDGAFVGYFFSSNFGTLDSIASPYGQIIVKESKAETIIQTDIASQKRVNISPPAAYHFNMSPESAAAVISGESRIYKQYYQHLVTNLRPGIVSDMTAMCALSGLSTATANQELRSAAAYSTLQTSADSSLRFYNSGTTDGTVSVTLYGGNDDQPLGYWTSPLIPAGSVQEYSIATLEKEADPHQAYLAYKPPAITKQNYYAVGVRTNIDGYFQQVLRNSTERTESNLSTCSDSVTTIGRALMGVHSSTTDATYRSTIIVHNTGAAPSQAVLVFYRGYDGHGINIYKTPTIPANGSVAVKVSDFETTANFPPPADVKYYNVTLEQPFTGFLQHLVTNRVQGIVSDMTAVCEM